MLSLSEETLTFAREHVGEDTAQLLLAAGRYPGVDMKAAVQQIEGLRAARDKWPSLLARPDYLYPPRLNREQSSSEPTAHYKASTISPFTVADLTGGMGIDTLAFARVAQHVDYVERDPQLCALMEHNLRALGVTNVTVHCADSLDWLQSHLSPFTFHLIYLDPARRDASGRKVAGFEDCTPNILDHMPLLRQRCSTLLVKASPMIDIDLACRQLGAVSEVHVVEIKGECKEVLFLLGGAVTEEPRIVCANLNNQSILNNQNTPKTFIFSRSEEATAVGAYCDTIGNWLYEPGAALMKAGPYRLLAQRYGLLMLAPSTHLYTADRLVGDFPGRVLRVLQEIKGGRKELATLLPEGRAHVVTRNYPVEAATLQRQLGLREGGDLFVVGATVGRRRTLLLCQPA